MSEAPSDKAKVRTAARKKAELRARTMKSIARFDKFLNRKPEFRTRRRPMAIMLIVGIGIAVLMMSFQERQDWLNVMVQRNPEIRVVIPLAISMREPGPRPEFTAESLRGAVDAVTPLVQQCMVTWPGLESDGNGRMLFEIVLGPDGPLEGAAFSAHGIPSNVTGCLGTAMAGVVWPQTDKMRRHSFAVESAK